MFTESKLKKWQRELDSLVEETGVSLDDVCNYIGVKYNRITGFYVKIPRKKRMLIGIGMAFRQPLDVINNWIVRYGDKKRLYCKDVLEDLIWIYLIKANCEAEDRSINFYELYDACQHVVSDTYMDVWQEIKGNTLETVDVQKNLYCVDHDSEFEGLRKFVALHIDSFKNAYSKPRKMLESYTTAILATLGKSTGNGDPAPLNALRGWVDDSMINYLAGTHTSINVNNRKLGRKTPEFKHVPKSRRSHVAICLALGMAKDEINKYLESMGFSLLDDRDISEATLIDALDRWSSSHPRQKRYKARYINKTSRTDMSADDEHKAVLEMLSLRQELSDEYAKRKISFPYIKD